MLWVAGCKSISQHALDERQRQVTADIYYRDIQIYLHQALFHTYLPTYLHTTATIMYSTNSNWHHYSTSPALVLTHGESHLNHDSC